MLPWVPAKAPGEGGNDVLMDLERTSIRSLLPLNVVPAKAGTQVSRHTSDFIYTRNAASTASDKRDTISDRSAGVAMNGGASST